MVDALPAVVLREGAVEVEPVPALAFNSVRVVNFFFPFLMSLFLITGAQLRSFVLLRWADENREITILVRE